MRKLVIVATALVAALALSGCTAHTGTAADVDGEPIAVTTVDRATRELNELFTVDPRGVLSMLIVAPVYLDEAGDLGLGKSQAEARAYLADVAMANELDLDIDAVSDATLDILRFDMAVRDMNQLVDPAPVVERINGRLAELDVDVNPRFGEFTGQVVAPSTPDWIVTAPAS